MRGRACAAVLLVALGACSQAVPLRHQATPRELGPGGELYNAELLATVHRNRQLAKERMADDRPASADEIASIGKLMDAASTLRELSFVRDVPVRVQSKKGIRAYLRTLMDDARVQRAYVRAHALALLPPKMTLEKLKDEASKLELLGYYEPRKKYLVLRDDVAYGLSTVGDRWDRLEWRSTIVHELVHALQDQHFDLGRHMQGQHTTDEDHAFMALAEGDASFTELRFGIARLGVSVESLVSDMVQFEQLINGLPSTSVQGAMAMPIEQQPGMFRYRAGAVFVAGLWRDFGVRGINRAFQKPPRSSDEVLERDPFMAVRRPPPLELPIKAALQRAGYTLHHEDTLGRIELAAYLQSSGLGGDILANTWLADRIAVFERKGSYAAVWAVRVRKLEDAKAIASRAIDVGRDEHGQATARVLGFARNGFAVILSNVDAALHASLQAQLSTWIDRMDAREERNAEQAQR